MTTTDFKYPHSGAKGLPLDLRTRFTNEETYSDFYFLGFRIQLEKESRYYHAWIAADNDYALMAGVDVTRDGILEKYLPLAPRRIDLVHVQNLQLRHLELNEMDIKMVREQLQQTVEIRNDEKFVYLCYDPRESNMAMSHCLADDAVAAATIGRGTWREQFGKSARTWAIFQAHPVMKEFGTLFDMEAPLIESLLRGEPPGLPN